MTKTKQPNLFQWGCECPKHLNTKLFKVRISNASVFKWSVYVLSYVLDRPSEYQYIRKQDGVRLSVFKWLGCPVFKWHFNAGPFGVDSLKQFKL